MSQPQRHSQQTGPLGRRDAPSERFPVLPIQQYSQRSARIPSHLLVQVANPDGSVTTFGVPVETKIIIGREDPTIDFKPQLDLAPFNGQEAGVSRQHAMILEDGDKLILKDNQSRNGTILNDNKLDPASTPALHDGDVVQFGKLCMTIYFVYATVKK
jgi:pSer/pThr/pTyr-binding forkhead associated (FHA) protein